MIKQIDFDERVDVLPVSDPNIFSMSQRVMLANEILQVVNSNPEIHGIQGMCDIYCRMYSAMGVQNIESYCHHHHNQCQLTQQVKTLY